MSTILIADDHPLFREALRGAVQRILPGATLCEADSVDALAHLLRRARSQAPQAATTAAG